MNILILTHHLGMNYGCLLQAYALQQVLVRMKHQAVTDRFSAEYEVSLSTSYKMRISASKTLFQAQKLCPWKRPQFIIGHKISHFINEHINTIDFFRARNSPNLKALKKFDAIIVGSDQVWRALYKDPLIYFLKFAQDSNIKKIAYAASFGVDHWDEYSDSVTEECRCLASKFTGISVREDSGVELCKKHLLAESTHVLDPTLLLESSDYNKLIEDEGFAPLANSMMCYILDSSNEKQVVINHVASSLNLEPLEIMPKETYGVDSSSIDDCTYPSVSAWLRGFRDAKFVITDSFHGTVFAIIFNVPFIAIVNKKRGAARFSSLLKMFNLEHRLIYSADEINDDILGEVDFESVNKIKKQWYNKSIEFLRSSLSN